MPTSCGNLGDAWAAVPASPLRRAPQNMAHMTLHVQCNNGEFGLTMGTVISLSAVIPSYDARETVSQALSVTRILSARGPRRKFKI
jgi:hypothetical protein